MARYGQKLHANTELTIAGHGAKLLNEYVC